MNETHLTLPAQVAVLNSDGAISEEVTARKSVEESLCQRHAELD